MWTQIVSLAKSIQFQDAATAEYVVTSCQYGLDVYRIYRDGFQLSALSQSNDKARLGQLIQDYDETWAEYKKLPVGTSLLRHALYGQSLWKQAPGSAPWWMSLEKGLCRIKP